MSRKYKVIVNVALRDSTGHFYEDFEYELYPFAIDDSMLADPERFLKRVHTNFILSGFTEDESNLMLSISHLSGGATTERDPKDTSFWNMYFLLETSDANRFRTIYNYSAGE